MAHTPGPWECRVVSNENHTEWSAFAVRNASSPKASQADARLIAAAPELLKAAGELRVAYIKLVLQGATGTCDPASDEHVIMIEAALDKAEGR